MPQSQCDSVWLVLPWSPDLHAGVSVVVSRLREEFISRQMNPHIIVADWSAPEMHCDSDGYWRFRFAILGALTAAGLLRAALQLPFRLWRTFYVLRRHRVCVVNFHYVGLDALGVAMLRWLHLYRGKLVLSFHGTDVRMPRSCLERRLWRFLLASADAITACSASLAAKLTVTYGDKCREAKVIHNGVDANLFRPRCGAERDGAILVPARYLVSVGSFIPRKGHRAMLEAFARVAGDYPDLHLLIIGQDGPERLSLGAFAERGGLGDRLDCRTDLQPKAVASILAGAVASVQPSLAEPFGIAVIEAGACGIPVIASAVGGHLEVLNGSAIGATGFLFDAGDVDHCAQVMRRVLCDPEGASVVAHRFRQIVIERYTWKACADRYALAFAVYRRARGRS